MRPRTEQFELDGKVYCTDPATLSLLRDLIPVAEETGDSSAVAAVMFLGLHCGQIVRYRGDDETAHYRCEL